MLDLNPHAASLVDKFYGGISQFEEACSTFSGGDIELEKRMLGYIQKKWLMFSSPIISNTKKGLPISCFISYVGDTIRDLVEHQSEYAYLSVNGGGVGASWDVRAPDNKSGGIVPFLKVMNSSQEAFRQNSRKGSYAAYLDVKHPEIMEFVSLRTPQGDMARKCLDMNLGVNLTNDFMQRVKSGGKIELVDPKYGKTGEEMDAREIWYHILEQRWKSGEPYLCFIDTANEKLNQMQKEKGLKIRGSNICTEIFLTIDERRTCVCCLSSLNLETWDEWCGVAEQLLLDLVTFLDNVLSVFIERCPPEMEKARYSAMMERSIGIGAMGFHALLQKKGLAIESAVTVGLNKKIFRTIKENAVRASQKLAVERGEPEDLKGSGMRNAHLLAIAPNANSSVLCGTSPSIEPWSSNWFVHRSRAGAFEERNKYLEQLLQRKGLSFDLVKEGQGSVSHLTKDLTDVERNIFKVSTEIDQKKLVQLAADRQEWVCQGQSLNLFFANGCTRKYFHEVHLLAWELGLKSLYYCRVDTKTQVQYNQNKSCVSCEG